MNYYSPQFHVEAIYGCATFILDLLGYILSGNPDSVKFSPPEINLIGQHFSVFYSPEAILQEKPSRILQKALATGEYRGEIWYLDQEETAFLVEVVVTPLRDRHHQLIGFCHSLYNLHQRQSKESLEIKLLAERNKELEYYQQALMGQNFLLQSILDSIADGVIVTDLKNRLFLFNESAREMFGKPEIYTQVTDWLERYDCYFADQITPYQLEDLPFVTAAKGEKIDQLEMFIYDRESTKSFWLNINASPILGEQNAFQGSVAVLRNITEQKQGETRLQELYYREKILGNLVREIHQSLDLQQILKITVTQIIQIINCDRVLIYQCQENHQGTLVEEALNEPYYSLQGWRIRTSTFRQNKFLQELKQGHCIYLDNLQESQDLPSEDVELWSAFGVKALVIIPIIHGDEIWGFLMLHQCNHARKWQLTEVEFMEQLGTQVGIAIYQAELYQQLTQANIELQYLALIDGLTKVANRRRFDQYLSQEGLRMAREKAPLSLILCDIDFFKAYNDTYGHLAGDACLQKVAKALRNVIKRPADLVARYGGEEFALVLPQTDAKGAMYLAENVRSHLRALQLPHDSSLVNPYVTLSMGVASVIPQLNFDPAYLIALADHGLYQAKSQGRDRYVFYADQNSTPSVTQSS